MEGNDETNQTVRTVHGGLEGVKKNKKKNKKEEPSAFGLICFHSSVSLKKKKKKYRKVPLTNDTAFIKMTIYDF